MPLVEFPYIRVDIPASEPFPNGQIAWRPLAAAAIRAPGNNRHLRCVALLDSGADTCLFPALFASHLGIDLLTLKKSLTGGVGSAGNVTYYTELEITLGQGVQFTSRVGFTPAMDQQGIGLLGQFGFFDYYSVCFYHKQKRFTIETT